MKTLKEALFSRKNLGSSFDFLNDGRSFLIQTESKDSDYNIYTIILNEGLTGFKNKLIVEVKCGKNRAFSLDIEEAKDWLSGKTKIIDLIKRDSSYKNDKFYADKVYLIERDDFDAVLYNDFYPKNYADIEKATSILNKL